MDKYEATEKAFEDRVPTHCVWCQKEATRTEVVHTGDIWQRWCYCNQCDLESYHPIEKEDEATTENPLALNRDVICRASFKGRIPKGQLYYILEYIDGMKQRGYTYEKHERVDDGEWATIDYVLVQHGI